MTVKLAISLSDEVAAQVRSAVRRGRAPSVSAYIAAALEAYEEPLTAEEFFEELDAELGPPSAEAEARVGEQFRRLGWAAPAEEL